MSSITVRNLVKSFGEARAIDDISFAVRESEILVIMGASGCGKTTTLRCIAGLEQPSSGTIEVDGRTVVADGVFVPPEQRGIGMMFQSYALWPHKSVFDNVAYGLSMRRLPKAQLRDAVGRALDLVGLSHLGDRFPSTLSGGQQQRVALARSAVVEPKVLLLDEPLSNLDAKLREQMRLELRQLVKSLGMTAIHITHDQSEAMAIADNVIYMKDGRIEQEGSPRALYRTPRSRAVAEFVGTATFLNGTIIGDSGRETLRIRISDTLQIKAHAPSWPAATREVTVALRPECLRLSTAKPDGDNAYPATVMSETFLGESTEYILDVFGEKLKCRDRMDFAEGSNLFVQLDPREVICLHGSH